MRIPQRITMSFRKARWFKYKRFKQTFMYMYLSNKNIYNILFTYKYTTYLIVRLFCVIDSAVVTLMPVFSSSFLGNYLTRLHLTQIQSTTLNSTCVLCPMENLADNNTHPKLRRLLAYWWTSYFTRRNTESSTFVPVVAYIVTFKRRMISECHPVW